MTRAGNISVIYGADWLILFGQASEHDFDSEDVSIFIFPAGHIQLRLPR